MNGKNQYRCQDRYRPVGGAFARLIHEIIDRYLPEDANNPKRAEKFWKDTKFWCAFVGGISFVVLEIRGWATEEKALGVEPNLIILELMVFINSSDIVILFTFYTLLFIYILFMILFFCWLVYNMSEKVGRTRAYFLGLLLPTITVYGPALVT